jgi:hypothetical protein
LRDTCEPNGAHLARHLQRVTVRRGRIPLAEPPADIGQRVARRVLGMGHHPLQRLFGIVSSPARKQYLQRLMTHSAVVEGRELVGE